MNDKIVAKELVKIANDLQAKSVSKRVTTVFDKEDFKNQAIWYGILDDFGIEHGDDIDGDEPDRITVIMTEIKID